MLSAEQWASLLAASAPEAREITLLGSAAERGKAEEFCRVLATALPRAKIENACGGLSLLDSARAIAAADRFWSIDTGLLHIARLLGVPSTSFWGPTDPATLLMPVPDLDEAVNYRRIACSPCVHITEIPPCGGRNLCMHAHTEPVDPNPVWIVRG